MTEPLPPGWTLADVNFLLEQARQWPIVLVGDPGLGLPGVQDIPAEACTEWGFGIIQASTGSYEILFDRDGRTPSGQAWTYVDLRRGAFPYDREAVLARLNSYLGKASEAAEPVPPAQFAREEELPPTSESQPAADIQAGETQFKITLTFREEAARFIARDTTLVAICARRRFPGNGEAARLWRLYYACNFTGVKDPGTGGQVSGSSLEALVRRASEILHAQVELAGAPAEPISSE